MEIDPRTACGIVGAACFVISYFGALQGWLDPAGWRFPALNLLAAGLVLVSLINAWNLPSVVLECFWATISMYGVVRNWRRQREAEHGAKREHSMAHPARPER